jgi:hypothetical protein
MDEQGLDAGIDRVNASILRAFCEVTNNPNDAERELLDMMTSGGGHESSDSVRYRKNEHPRPIPFST